MKKLLFAKIELLLILIFTTGCIMPTTDIAISPSYNKSKILSISIWRFRDGGRISNSGDIATRAIESAFIREGFRMVSFSKIRDIISVEIGYTEGMSLEAGMLTPAVLKRIREETGSDAIILGSVSDSWTDIRYAPSSWIECSFQMIDTNTGEILISANVSDDGWSVQSAAKQMAERVVKELKRK